MHDNDKTIEDYRKKIESKRSKLGTRPKVTFESNGVLILKDEAFNLNTLDVYSCKRVLADILIYKLGVELVNNELNTNDPNDLLDNYLHDIKQRIVSLIWHEDKKKLNAMDKKLSDLLSDKAKTENTIKDIGKELNLD